MKEITIRIPDNKYRFLIELLNNLGFVHFEEETIDKKDVIESIDKGLSEIKRIQEGKIKSRPAKEFLDEL